MEVWVYAANVGDVGEVLLEPAQAIPVPGAHVGNGLGRLARLGHPARGGLETGCE